jgi:Uncharacterized conserved protein (DUF2285)
MCKNIMLGVVNVTGWRPVSRCGASGDAIPAPPPGASAPFVDPALTAPDAPVCWLETSGAAIIDARSNRPADHAAPDLVLTDLPCVTHIVEGPANIEHLLIRTTTRSVILRLHGVHVIDSPVVLTFQVPGLAKARPLGALLRALPDLLSATPRHANHSIRQMLMRNALIALDGRRAGAHYRDLAAIIYGRRMADDAWKNHNRSLKDRLHRALTFGIAMRDGGYRTLLT